ncbi:hypothetical protein F4860DRAFT_524145 [Xylaria cubensis]|nr:hypothetical protein F4860DRAFT_524145 [Xylaria cubensis]
MVNRPKSVYWRPLWLRKAVLFAFMATFIISALGLVLIWHLVRIHDGIPLTLTTNHYAWTYGPTAVLTVIVSLWRQVNYCTMINQPWQELYNGPQQATKTVLLDYIWPFQLTSFIEALKNKHPAVAITILIFALLKLVMVVSTTLFVLGNTTSSQDISVNLLTKFNATRHRDPPGPVIPTIVTSDPVWDYLIIREQYGDMTPPVQLSTAFTNYSITSKLPEGAGEASVQVDVFQVNVTCEVPTVRWLQDDLARTYNLTLNAPSCDIGTIEIFDSYNTGNISGDTLGRYFKSGSVFCEGQGLANLTPVDSRGTTNKYRHVYIAAQSGLTIISKPSLSSDSFEIVNHRVAAVSCDLEHSISQGIAHGPAFDTSKIDSLQIIEGTKRHINSLTNMQILEAIFDSLITGGKLTGTIGYKLPIEIDNIDLFKLLADSRSVGYQTFDPLLNVSLLQSRAEKHLAGLSHQVMRRVFLSPDNTASSGSIDYTVQKLYIRAASIWTMVGLLIMMSCFMVIIIVYSKPSVAPQSPATIAAVAYTVSRSPDLNELLQELSAMRLSEIRKALVKHDFVTVQDRAGVPRVEAIAMIRQETPPNPPGLLRRKWNPRLRKQSPDLKPRRKTAWMPFSGRGHAISLTIILPTLAIVVLEILWYLSENDNRFITVSSDSSIDAYAVRFGSTASMLIISTLFNALDFAIATISPFSALAAGYINPERTLYFTIVGDLPPVALWKAIYHMHLGAALSLVASTIGNLLTVVISGLWFNTPIEFSRETTAEVQSGWNIDFLDLSPYGSTISFFDELQHGRVNASALIWGNIVLPEIGHPQPSIPSGLREAAKNQTLQYCIVTPAIRPHLECTIIPQSAIVVNNSQFAQPDIDNPVREFRITALLPTGCHSSIPADPSGTISFSLWGNDFSGRHSKWLGSLSRLEAKPSSNSTLSEGCPSFGAMFGTYEHNDLQLQPQSNLTALLCTQYLQSVEVNVSYTGSQSKLFAPDITGEAHVSSPPKNILDVHSGSYSISTSIDNSFRKLETTQEISEKPNFHPFFWLLTNKGTNREKFLGSGNIDTLISAMNDLYQSFMVHVIDRECRSTIGGENTTIPIPNGGVVQGTVTISVSRLKINRTSKIILQAFLSTMVVFGGLAWWTVDLRVLPRNPYPIASSMAFLAGSRLVGGTSQAANGGENQEQPMKIRRKPLVVMKGKRFRLGWWEDSNAEAGSESDSNSQPGQSSTRKRFGIDVEDADEAASSTALQASAIPRRRWFRWR